MKILRAYIDTSIVGGYFDPEFLTATRALFGRLRQGEIIFVRSSVLERELSR